MGCLTAAMGSSAAMPAPRYAVVAARLPSYAGTVEILGPKGHVQRVLSRGNDGWSASWSPNGSMIAWVDHRGLLVARADGTRPRLLVRASRVCTQVCAPLTFAWSPNGHRLLVGGAGKQTSRLVSVAVWTGKQIDLVAARPYTEYDVLGWSPNGAWIAYARSSGKWGTSTCCDLHLVVARPDGSGARRLFRFADPIHDTPYGSWSPDSRSIAFTSDNPHFAIVDVQSSTVRRITGISPLIGPPPAWSPDSKRLAVIGEQVMTVDTSGHHVRRLGTGGERVVWTRGGTLIIVRGTSSSEVLATRDEHRRPHLLFRMPKKLVILALDVH